MTESLFSQPWVDAWKDRINCSDRYATSASSWDSTMGLVIEPDPADGEAPAILLELEAGCCREAQRVRPGELEGADYVLSASRPTWMELLEKGRDPVWALMNGKLKLARGSMTGLMPYAAAAKELLATARGIEVAAPERAATEPDSA